MSRPKGSTVESIQDRWFEQFERMSWLDRESALLVLKMLHKRLPKPNYGARLDAEAQTVTDRLELSSEAQKEIWKL